MKKTITVLAIASVIALTGCGSNNQSPADQGPRQGVILEKEHERGEWESKKKCTKTVNGVCKSHSTKREWDDDDYSFLLKEGDRENWVEVDEDDFNEFEEGETYTVE
jgi:hypothetical protein